MSLFKKVLGHPKKIEAKIKNSDIDYEILNMEMKIMVVGFSTAGKTHFLGSLFKLGVAGDGNFSVQPADQTATSDFEKIFKAVEKKTPLAGTVKMKKCDLILRHSIQDAVNLTVIDVEGQAIAGDNPEVAKAILSEVPTCDAFIIIVNAPQDEVAYDESAQKLAQSVNFVVKALQVKPTIPVVLVLSKMDILPDAKGVKSDINDIRKQLIGSETDPTQIIRLENQKLGEAISSRLKNIVETVPMYRIIHQFFNGLKGVAKRVFVCTSSGFDSANDSATQPSQLVPYGTGAAFLWTVYAALKNQQQKNGVNANTHDKLADALLEQITNIHRSGKAYYQNEGLWSIRTLGFLDQSEQNRES